MQYDEEKAALLRLKIKSLGYQINRVGNLRHPKAQHDHYVWMILDDYMTGISTNCGYLGWREVNGWELEIDLDHISTDDATALWSKLNEVCAVSRLF